MREKKFIEHYESDWQALDDYLQYKKANVIKRKKQQLVKSPISDKDFPVYYRRLCNQLALAQTRHFSEHLIARLNRLVLNSHHFLYRRRGGHLFQLFQFIFADFPAAVRREKTVMLWALVAFLLPAVLVFVLVQFAPITAYSFVDQQTLSDMESMYEPVGRSANGITRTSESDIAMFGHYIFNNISIALRSFAGGLILGVGAIVTAVFNGVHLGVVFSHLQNVGYASKTLYPFVITHSAFELTAIVISSGAGLKLGLSFLFPGRYARGQSIARTAQALLPIIIGFSLMLFIAAMIEAFWSASSFPNWVKYTVGGMCWGLVIAYFTLAGRANESR